MRYLIGVNSCLIQIKAGNLGAGRQMFVFIVVYTA